MVQLFETVLTSDDIERALQEALGTSSKFGENVAFTDLGGGKGIVSEVGLLTTDWSPPNQLLPATFAIKVSAPKKPIEGNQLAELAQRDLGGEKQQRVVNYHNTEILILSILEKHGTGAKVPKVYAAKRREAFADAGYIVMKHYSDVDSTLHMNNNLPEYGIDFVLNELSKIHSSSDLFSEEEKTKLTDNLFQNTFNVWFEEPMIKNLVRMAKEFGGEMMAKETEQLEEVLMEMSQPEYLKFVDETCENLGIPRLLCHGDVWMCNMLWKRTGDCPSNEEYELQALIDLQTAQFGCPAVDLVRLFTGCMSGRARRDTYRKHIKNWWCFMNAERVGGVPYTLEQTIEAYYRVFPCCAFVVAGSIAAVGMNIIKKQPDEDSQRLAHKNLLEKQHALLQDIIKYHKRNMSIMKSSK